MRCQYLACLLLAGLAYGQAAPPVKPPAAAPSSATPAAGAPAEPGAAPAPAPEVKVGPEDAVITIVGFCAAPAQPGDACRTVITRAQFEKVVEALQPGMALPLRRQLATRYAWVLKMSAAAEKRGLDKSPAFEEKMNFARMQILSQELSGALQEDSNKVSDADIADYYKKNEASYEQATFQRIFIPRSKQVTNPAVKPKPGEKTVPPAPPTEAQQKAAEEAMTKLAKTLQARAVAGEDFDKLQKEAFAAAGLPGNPANTKVEKARRSSLPANHQAVMDLKPGQVSEVISDPTGGHYIYKMISEETLTLESVSPEIRKTISSQSYRDSMQSFQSGVDLNDAYFGATRAPGMPLPPRGARKPPVPNNDPDKD